MDYTKKEILEATRELENALLECLEANKAEDDIKIKKIKAQKRLSLARDTVRSLTIR